MPTFIELFAGGGLVRAGLGSGWTCVYANDCSPAKAETYWLNYGPAELRVKDIREVTADELPKADLLWASFPCQDHSAAGCRSGFKEGERGRLVFHVLDLLARVASRGNTPNVIAPENVPGLLSADAGKDFERLLTGLVSIGYRPGAVVIDAVHWLPHSRPRLFIVAHKATMPITVGLALPRPRGLWYPKALVRVLDTQPPAVARDLLWWTLPAPAPRTLELRDIVEPFGSGAEKWRNARNIAKLLATCRPDDRKRLVAARTSADPVYGEAVFRRGGQAQHETRVLALRTDGVVNCLMGKADLRYGQLLRVHRRCVGIRPFTIGEFGRLMGVPDGYRMPPSVSQAARLAGEGVAVPVVRWLAAHLLEQLVRNEDQECIIMQPRQRPNRARKDFQAAPRPDAGVKQTSVGTTAYLLPEESARVHALAADLGASVHEVLMRGLDRMFMERGLPPVRRIPNARRGARARRGADVDIARLPSRRRGRHFRCRFRPRTTADRPRVCTSSGQERSAFPNVLGGCAGPRHSRMILLSIDSSAGVAVAGR